MFEYVGGVRGSGVDGKFSWNLATGAENGRPFRDAVFQEIDEVSWYSRDNFATREQARGDELFHGYAGGTFGGWIGGVTATVGPTAHATQRGKNAQPTNTTGNGGEVGSQGSAGGNEAHPHDAPVDFHKLYVDMEFYDDVKGGELDREKVIEARRLEMQYFKTMGVYSKVPRGRPRASGQKSLPPSG